MSQDRLLNLGEINIKPTSYYVAFVGKKNVVCITTRKNKLVACINLKFTEIEDYKKQVRDVSKIGHNGTGECEYSLDNIQDLDYLMTLIKQSYAKNG
jgi:predicted transport protein